MMKSMTGYGKSQKEIGGRICQVEIKSINSKTLDLSCKLPAEYRELEADFRLPIAGTLLRGKVECQLTVARKAGVPDRHVFHLNREQIGIYMDEAESLQSMYTDRPVPVAALLGLPGVVRDDNPDTLAEDEKKEILELLTQSLQRADESRIQEGEVLKRDFRLRVEKIERYLAEAEVFEPQRVPAIRQRLERNLAEWGGSEIKPDTNRLEQEMIYYLEKLDITEEKVRLRKHCRYFIETMEEEASGRKLGFIAQEMGREINTLGSKANEANIQKIVVQMKDELEKIKEQLFNIL